MYAHYELFNQQEADDKGWKLQKEMVVNRKGCPARLGVWADLFNLFQNDLIGLLERCFDVYNYADDNTIGAAG